MIEETTRFGTPSLVGVLCRPDDGSRADLPGVVLLTPGLLHRVGSNRTYVSLARALADDGFTVLRFDHPGKGDSPSRNDDLTLRDAAVAEATAAIDHVLGYSGASHVLLIGHCSGSFLGLAMAYLDERVAGVVAISPEAVGDDWVEFDRRRKEARYYSNYYGRSAIADTGRWRRLVTGKVDYRSIARNVFRGVVWYRLSTLVYRIRIATGTYASTAAEHPDIQEFNKGLRTLGERGLPILFIHPDQSDGRKMLRALLGDTIQQMHEADEVDMALISACDHMFTPLAAQRELVETVRRWSNGASAAVAVTTLDAVPVGASL